MSRTGRIHRFAAAQIALVVVLLAGARLRADHPLQADELLLLYNKNLPESRELAEHYARVRHVPDGRLCGLDLAPRDENIDRDDYLPLIRDPVRAYLEEHQLREQVRCLVSFYGLPIKVGPFKPDDDLRKMEVRWRQKFLEELDAFDRAVDELATVAGGEKPALSARKPTEKDYLPIMQRYVEVRNAAVERAASAPEDASGAQARQEFVIALRPLDGLVGVIGVVNPRADHPTAAEKVDEAKRMARQGAERAQELLALPLTDPVREDARDMIREISGMRGVLASLEGDLARCRTEETHAALDSELALLWWDNYGLFRWVINTQSWRQRADADMHRTIPEPFWDAPVMMTARLDGASPKVVRRMIDDAVAAEAVGLEGTVWIDARGKRPGDPMAEYDQNLRDLAALLWRETELKVRLDNKAEVYGTGKCPDAMLYCGWYSLRQYVDAFDWVPGAVGYHIASFEAMSLKNPKERGWVKNMLDDGVAGTLGPVAEPYLLSVPLPTDFFGMLLTGRFTLAEVYAYTVPFNSWMQMLLGDPLYRPFAVKPRLTLEQVFDADLIPPEYRSATAPAP